MSINNPAKRRRKHRLSRLLFIFKRIAWRATALWCWIHGLTWVFGGKVVVRAVELQAFAISVEALTNVGFAPGNQSSLIWLFKSIWLLTITGFSWVEIIGLLVYISFAPLTLLFYSIKRGKDFKEEARVAFEKVHQEKLAQKRNTTTYFLTTILASWFLLFGDTTQRPALAAAMFITGLLFLARIYRAFEFTTLIGQSGKNWIDRFIEASVTSVVKAGASLKTEQVLNLASLRFTLYMNSKLYSALRLFSRWSYGRAAQRRVALLVLLDYLFNFSALGLLSILFWSFAIKYSTAPNHIGTAAALFASATHVIPGIPDSAGLRVDAWIQAAIAVTAWMLFVLYAGPVSSLYPEVQKRSVNQVISIHVELTTARRKMFPIIQRMKSIVAVVRNSPLAKHFYQLATLIVNRILISFSVNSQRSSPR
jgi:hypothetical protein